MTQAFIEYAGVVYVGDRNGGIDVLRLAEKR